MATRLTDDRLSAIAADFADTYRLDRFQGNKLRELLLSLPSLTLVPDRVVVCKHFRAAIDGTGHLTPAGWVCAACHAEEVTP